MSAMENKLYMKDFLPKKYKHLLYRDECPELTDFIITKCCEVYRYSENVLRCIFWSKAKRNLLAKSASISDLDYTDDSLYLCSTDNANFDKIIALGITKQRIYKNGKRLKQLEEKLGHKIIPYRPELEGIQ